MAKRFGNHTFKAALMICLSASVTACSTAPGITPQEAAIRDHVSVDRYMPATREMRDNIETQELFAQAAFWSHEYELNPSDLEATLKLAAAVRKLGNPAQSVQITQTSRAIHPRDPYLLAEHAAGLIATERALDAMPIIDQGLAIAPAYGRLWSLKGAAFDQMEDYQSARQAYSRALQITPNDPNVLTNIGLSHALSGDLATAEAWIRRAASAPGAGAGVRQNLAMIMQLQGRTEEAERQARIARLSQGDRKLPPPPVPAFTPRSTGPASQGGPYNLSPSSQNAMAGRPASRLTTMTPDGRTFSSASEAARMASQSRQFGPQTYLAQDPSGPAGPMPLLPNGEMTPQQQAVLNSVGQSFNQAPTQAPAIPPNAHVVGPALRQQAPQMMAPAQQAVQQQQQQPVQQRPQPQQPPVFDPAAGSGLVGGPSGREPARRRR